jgi:hypothetical protein
MIEVTIRLKSARGKSRDRMLGVIVIGNDGTGTEKKGNYNYVLSHSGNYFGKRKEPYKKGRIKGYPRKWSVYRLIQRVLRDAGEL